MNLKNTSADNANEKNINIRNRTWSTRTLVAVLCLKLVFHFREVITLT